MCFEIIRNGKLRQELITLLTKHKQMREKSRRIQKIGVLNSSPKTPIYTTRVYSKGHGTIITLNDQIDDHLIQCH